MPEAFSVIWEISTHAPRTGSDLGRHQRGIRRVYFNPRSPHGERRADNLPGLQRSDISTHAPRTGSDNTFWHTSASAFTFQPTLPARGATNARRRMRRLCGDFNPRSPHGERPVVVLIDNGLPIFQPTLPARGATIVMMRSSEFGKISTHAPRTGSDPCWWGSARFRVYFNPRSPHGERLPRCASADRVSTISTHAPRTGSDKNRL